MHEGPFGSADYSIIKDETAIKNFLEENRFEKEKFLKKYGINEEYLKDIISRHGIDESDPWKKFAEIIKQENQFSSERHKKSEEYYAKVFPKNLWNTFTGYEKEKRASQIDYLEKEVLGEHAMKIRVRPFWINQLRKLLGVNDFKGGGYWGDTIYLCDPEDLKNPQIIRHEGNHVLQQQESGPTPFLGFLKWAIDSFLKQPKEYKEDNKGKTITVDELTTRIPNEMHSYSNQHVEGYLKGERKNETAMDYEGKEGIRYGLEKIQRANYGLVLEDLHLHENILTEMYNFEQLLKKRLEKINDEKERGDLLDIQNNLKDIINNLSNLNNESNNRGEDLRKRNDLVPKYIEELSKFIGILGQLSDGIVLDQDENKELSEIRKNIENIKHDLTKNEVLNKESVKDRDMRVFNQVPKVKDTERVIRILEERLKEIKKSKESGNSELVPSTELKENVKLFRNEIINAGLLDMFSDYFETDEVGNLLDTPKNEISDSVTDTELLEKTIKELYAKRAEYQRTPTFIRLEEKGHQELSEKLSDITEALMRYGIKEDNLPEILEDVRKFKGLYGDNGDIFEKYFIDEIKFKDILNDVKKEEESNKIARKKKEKESSKEKNEKGFAIPLMIYRD